MIREKALKKWNTLKEKVWESREKHQFQLVEIHAFLIRSEIFEVDKIVSYNEVLEELRRLDNFWKKIFNWNESFLASESNPDLMFVINEEVNDFDSYDSDGESSLYS